MTDETDAALGEIVQNVVKVKDLVGEIAAASDEQARGVSQINVAMNQVAKAAQEGSQQSEELLPRPQLASVADRMREGVRRFKLRERRVARQNIPGLTDSAPNSSRRSRLSSPPKSKTGLRRVRRRRRHAQPRYSARRTA